MIYKGTLEKMETRLEDQVLYTLRVGEHKLNANSLLVRKLA